MNTKRMIVVPEEKIKAIQETYCYNTALDSVMQDLLENCSREIPDGPQPGERLYRSSTIFDLAKREMLKTCDSKEQIHSFFTTDDLEAMRFGIFTLLNAIIQSSEYCIVDHVENELKKE